MTCSAHEWDEINPSVWGGGCKTEHEVRLSSESGSERQAGVLLNSGQLFSAADVLCKKWTSLCDPSLSVVAAGPRHRPYDGCFTTTHWQHTKTSRPKMCPCFSVDNISHILLIPSEMGNYKFHYLLFCFHNTHLFRNEWSYTHYDYHLQSARLRRGEPLGARCFGLTNQNNVKKKKKKKAVDSCSQPTSSSKPALRYLLRVEWQTAKVNEWLVKLKSLLNPWQSKERQIFISEAGLQQDNASLFCMCWKHRNLPKLIMISWFSVTACCCDISESFLPIVGWKYHCAESSANVTNWNCCNYVRQSDVQYTSQYIWWSRVDSHSERVHEDTSGSKRLFFNYCY